MSRVLRDYLSDAEVCRKNGWIAGTRLAGDEGNGVTVIEITAVGEHGILAKQISHDNKADSAEPEMSWTLSCRKQISHDNKADSAEPEMSWTLSCRKWKKVVQS